MLTIWGIGTLESYVKMREYYGKENVCPVYIEVEDGERLARALKKSVVGRYPAMRKCAEDFLQIGRIFPKKKLLLPGLRENSRMLIWRNV